MMRAWGNRPDTFVCDEPFYAYYLHVTGREHPGAAEVIAEGETDWRKVVQDLIGEVPGGKRIFYQKQMTHHLLPEIDRGWLGDVTNCFLIRHPREVISSYIKKNDDPAVEDLGFVQQVEIFDWVRVHTGAIPPVIDSGDVLKDPEKILKSLCEAIGIEFGPTMLSWAPGLRETDGIWAKHWYTEVQTSTGFRKPPQRELEPVPERLDDVYGECLRAYEHLHQYRLRS